MKYCKKCLYPDTKPQLKFNQDGICEACLNSDKKNSVDWESRKKWDNYMDVYENIFKKCDEVPWHIIPADRNWLKVNGVAKVLLKALQDLKLKWPDLEIEKFKK